MYCGRLVATPLDIEADLNAAAFAAASPTLLFNDLQNESRRLGLPVPVEKEDAKIRWRILREEVVIKARKEIF